MKRDDVFAANNPVEFLHRFPVGAKCSDVITGGVEMTGVNTNGQTIGTCCVSQDFRQMFEPVAEIRSLAGRGFERDSYPALSCCAEDLVQAANDLAQALRFASAHVRAGMHHDERDANPIGALNLVNHRGDGHLEKGGVRCDKIYEVTAMGKDRLDLRLTLPLLET
jgi:hypothetical protein